MTIVFPLLSPTTFFLLVVNIVYAFFDTFGDHRRGDRRRARPGDADPRLQGLPRRLQGGSTSAAPSAQSVVLMVIVIALTVMQFRFVETQGAVLRLSAWSRTGRWLTFSSRHLILGDRRGDRRVAGLRDVRRVDADRASRRPAGADAAAAGRPADRELHAGAARTGSASRVDGAGRAAMMVEQPRHRRWSIADRQDRDLAHRRRSRSSTSAFRCARSSSG